MFLFTTCFLCLKRGRGAMWGGGSWGWSRLYNIFKSSRGGKETLPEPSITIQCRLYLATPHHRQGYLDGGNIIHSSSFRLDIFFFTLLTHAISIHREKATTEGKFAAMLNFMEDLIVVSRVSCGSSPIIAMARVPNERVLPLSRKWSCSFFLFILYCRYSERKWGLDGALLVGG